MTKTYTQDDIHTKAQNCVFPLITLYNAHAYFGTLSDIARQTVNKHTDSKKTYTEAEMHEILALVDSECRDYLD